MSRRKFKATAGQRMTLDAVYRLLHMYGCSNYQINAIRESLIYYSVTEGTDVKYDRIYSAVAILLWRRYQLSGLEIYNALHDFDAVCGSVLRNDETGEDGLDWGDLMQELKDNTGIVIHTGDDNRLICECEWEEEEEIEEDG